MSGATLACPLCKKGLGRLLVDAVPGADVSTLAHVCDRCGHEWKPHEPSRHDPELKPSDLHFDVLHASTSAAVVEPRIHKPLLDAIEAKTITELEFRDGKTRLGEPHVYGVINGVPRLLFFNQYGDEPAWSLIDVRKIVQVKRWLNQHFAARELPPEFDPGQ